MDASAVKAGDVALDDGSEAVADGVGSGVADSLTDGSGVSVTEGVGTLPLVQKYLCTQRSLRG